MSLIRRLAEELIDQHPEQAAAVLERIGSAETSALLQDSSAERAGAALRRLSPASARAALEALGAGTAGPILDTLPVSNAANLLRLLEADQRDAILEGMDRDRVRGVAALLRHPPGSAAAQMDPLVLALPQDATATEALALVREHADNARYNLYVVDREQRLVGVLNLRELMIAPPTALISDLMVRDPRCISAGAERTAVLSHPGWREVHALPVVDDDGVYLGAIRYRTLRRLESELRVRRDADGDASAALGGLFATGVGGLLDAISGSTQPLGGSPE